MRENREFQPDVVTLDINMPEMDGLTALSLIMAERPVAVVMVSSLTNEGALATFEASESGRGRLRCQAWRDHFVIHRPDHRKLVAKVRSAARARPRGKGFIATEVVRRMQEERKKAVQTSDDPGGP